MLSGGINAAQASSRQYNDSYVLKYNLTKNLGQEERGHSFQTADLAMARTALFVIDVQVDLAQNATTEIPHAKRIRGAGTSILQSARQAIDSASEDGRAPDLEIVFVQHEEVAEKGHLVKGSKPWELVFKPREDNGWERLVSKDVRDTFESNPQLAVQLKNEGIETIVAFGIQSECCVLSTCRGALAFGFKVVLLKGAHSTYDIDGRPAEAIEGEVESQLEKVGVEVVPWESWKPSAL